jgi:DNA-binding MarR family transcriptional regulator
MSASQQELMHARGVDKGNLRHSLANLEAKRLINISRTPSGRAEVVEVWITTRPLSL